MCWYSIPKFSCGHIGPISPTQTPHKCYSKHNGFACTPAEEIPTYKSLHRVCNDCAQLNSLPAGTEVPVARNPVVVGGYGEYLFLSFARALFAAERKGASEDKDKGKGKGSSVFGEESVAVDGDGEIEDLTSTNEKSVDDKSKDLTTAKSKSVITEISQSKISSVTPHDMAMNDAIPTSSNMPSYKSINSENSSFSPKTENKAPPPNPENTPNKNDTTTTSSSSSMVDKDAKDSKDKPPPYRANMTKEEFEKWCEERCPLLFPPPTN